MTVTSDRQGSLQLNTGDTFTRANGTESIVTPRGDAGVLLTTRDGRSTLMPFGNARVEVDDGDGQFKPVSPKDYPCGFT